MLRCDTPLPLKWRSFSELSPSYFPGVHRTTWLEARILERMAPLHSVGYATTWSQNTVNAYRAYIRASHDIAGCRVSARAVILTVMLRPCTAYRTGLRRIEFVHLNTGGKLVVEQGDNLAVAGRRDRLRLLASHFLRCVVEWLSDIRFRVGEGIGDLARGFVAQIADLVPGGSQYPILTPLQLLIATRALRLVGLLRRDFSQLLIAKLHSGLDLTTTDQDGLLTIGSGYDGIDPKVNADNWTASMRFVGNLTDDFDAAIVQPDFNQSAWQRDACGYADGQFPRTATGKRQLTIADLRALAQMLDQHRYPDIAAADQIYLAFPICSRSKYG
jgi:hypothetical protein